MNDITTYWGAYTTLAEVQASPFYVRVEIPVNPRHFEQWRNDVLSPPSLHHGMLPEALSKVAFTLHAVLPIPIRYLTQMSSLQLEYFARYLYDDQYEERKHSLRSDDPGEDYLEKLQRTYTTLQRIRVVYERRFDERVEDSSSHKKLSDAVEDMLRALEEDLERTERGEMVGKSRREIYPIPTAPPPLFPVRTRSPAPSPGFQAQSGSVDTLLDPITRGRGFRSLFQRDRGSPSAEGSDSARTQDPSDPQAAPSTPGLFTMAISPGDFNALRDVVESGNLTERALHAIQNIVRDKPSRPTSLEPGTRRIESGQLNDAALHVFQATVEDDFSRPASLNSDNPSVDNLTPSRDSGSGSTSAEEQAAAAAGNVANADAKSVDAASRKYRGPRGFGYAGGKIVML